MRLWWSSSIWDEPTQPRLWVVRSRPKGLGVDVDSVRNGFWDKKSRRPGAGKWNKSNTLAESSAISRGDTNGKRRRTGRGGGQNSCGGRGSAGGRGTSVAGAGKGFVDVDRGCTITIAIATCDGVWVRTGVSISVGGHYIGRR